MNVFGEGGRVVCLYVHVKEAPVISTKFTGFDAT